MKMGFKKKKCRRKFNIQYLGTERSNQSGAKAYKNIACPFPVLCCLGYDIRGWNSYHHGIHAGGLHYARLGRLFLCRRKP